MPPFWKALRLLGAIGDSNPAPPEETVTISAGETGLATDLYFPNGPRPYPAVLLCHGLLAEGRKEIRMRQFAHALKTIGFAVAVPSFPDAENFKITASTTGQILQSAHFCLRQPWTDPARFGIFGTSYAGTLGFLAAADPTLRDRLRWIGSIGAYFSLADVLKFGFGKPYFHNGAPFLLPPDPYVKEIFGKNFSGTVEEFANHPLLQDLSIHAGTRLNRRTRVVLCHSERDDVIPWPEMTRIAGFFRKQGLRVETFLFQKAPHARVVSWWRQRSYLQASIAILRAGQ